MVSGELANGEWRMANGKVSESLRASSRPSEARAGIHSHDPVLVARIAFMDPGQPLRGFRDGRATRPPHHSPLPQSPPAIRPFTLPASPPDQTPAPPAPW